MSKLDKQLQELTKYANRSIKAKQGFLNKYGNEDADVITPEELGLTKKDLTYDPNATTKEKRQSYNRLKAYKENKTDYRLINLSKPGEREEYTFNKRLKEFNRLLSEQNKVRMDLGNIIEQQKMYFYQRLDDGRILRTKGERDKTEQMLDYGVNLYRIKGKLYGKQGISRKESSAMGVYDLARGTFDSKLADVRAHTREATKTRNKNLKKSVLDAIEKNFSENFRRKVARVLKNVTDAEMVWLYHVDEAFTFGFIYSQSSEDAFIEIIKSSRDLLKDEKSDENERFKKFKAKLEKADLI